jgi:hypothetical protein
MEQGLPLRRLYSGGLIVDITDVEQVVLGHLKKRLIWRLALKDVALDGHHSCSGCPCFEQWFGQRVW